MEVKEQILQAKTVLGIELGSTRIKSVLIDWKGNVLAQGFFDWENSLVDGIWTYSLEAVQEGLRKSYGALRESVKARYGVSLKRVAAIGISAMMHGYIPLDKEGKQLSLFQTWRNTNTQEAADRLTELLDFNIPLRWSVAHLYQRILDKEAHVAELAGVYTLAAYIHKRLTGEGVIGVGDASGMFPIDSETGDYDREMEKKFDGLLEEEGYSFRLRDLFPRVLVAGEEAGYLTPSGAALLDSAGDLEAGIPLCPPEGDAGTGMVATNSVAPRTGNVSAGTSFFAMLVLEGRLKKLHREIDMVTTPSGFPCAMSHANNGTSDLNAWVGLFQEFSRLMGYETDLGEHFGRLYTHSLTGDPDGGGLMAYGYYSGESITGINEGRPLLLRTPESRFTLANLMRVHLYSALGAVKLGMDILTKEEGVLVDRLMGHGGFFKTKEVGQRALAASVGAPVTVMDTASEGGAWGIALLALYLADKKEGQSLEEYLENQIFTGMSGTTLTATPEEIKGFEAFMERYKAALPVEKAAVAAMDWRR